MKETVTLRLNDTLTISVKGIYVQAEQPVYYPSDDAYPGSPAEFVVENVRIEEGNIMDLMDWCNEMFIKEYNSLKRKMENDNKRKYYMEDIWFVLEDLCIQELENQ